MTRCPSSSSSKSSALALGLSTLISIPLIMEISSQTLHSKRHGRLEDTGKNTGPLDLDPDKRCTLKSRGFIGPITRGEKSCMVYYNCSRITPRITSTWTLNSGHSPFHLAGQTASTPPPRLSPTYASPSPSPPKTPTPVLPASLYPYFRSQFIARLLSLHYLWPCHSFPRNNASIWYELIKMNCPWQIQ